MSSESAVPVMCICDATPHVHNLPEAFSLDPQGQPPTPDWKGCPTPVVHPYSRKDDTLRFLPHLWYWYFINHAINSTSLSALRIPLMAILLVSMVQSASAFPVASPSASNSILQPRTSSPGSGSPIVLVSIIAAVAIAFMILIGIVVYRRKRFQMSLNLGSNINLDLRTSDSGSDSNSELLSPQEPSTIIASIDGPTNDAPISADDGKDSSSYQPPIPAPLPAHVRTTSPSYSHRGRSPSYSYRGRSPSYSYRGRSPSYSYRGRSPSYSHRGRSPSYSHRGRSPSHRGRIKRGRGRGGGRGRRQERGDVGVDS